MLVDLNNEIWKSVVGYEDSYQVSNLGRVRSVDRYVSIRCNGKRLSKGVMIRPSKSINGYLFVLLHKKQQVLRKDIHRLVAEAFIPNPNNLPFVNHIDEDKTNNNLSNLEWCTSFYNMRYGTCIERMVMHKSKPITATSTIDGTVLHFKSAKDAENKGYGSAGNITQCCLRSKYRKNGYSKGYIWNYAI